MRKLNTLILTLLSLSFISCGESSNRAIKDITSLHINEPNATIYSTDAAITLSATLTYSDGSSVDATESIEWSSSDESVVTSSKGSIIGGDANGGDANITASYNSVIYSQAIPVHVIALSDINISLLNAEANTTGTYQLLVNGVFEDATQREVLNHLSYEANNSATLTQEDESFEVSITATGETNITVTLFEDENLSQTLIYKAD